MNPSHKGCWALTDSNLMATGAPVEMLIPGNSEDAQLITWQTTMDPVAMIAYEHTNELG